MLRVALSQKSENDLNDIVHKLSNINKPLKYISRAAKMNIVEDQLEAGGSPPFAETGETYRPYKEKWGIDRGKTTPMTLTGDLISNIEGRHASKGSEGKAMLIVKDSTPAIGIGGAPTNTALPYWAAHITGYSIQNPRNKKWYNVPERVWNVPTEHFYSRVRIILRKYFTYAFMGTSY